MSKCDSNGDSMGENKSWFAVKVRERFERNICEGLEGKDIETLLPVYTVERRWSDRVKTLEVPLFSGYVFCRIDPTKRMPVLSVPGVHYFAGLGQAPEPLSESEAESLRALVSAGTAATLRPYLAEGERVRVEAGPLRGMEGVLLRGGDADQLVVSIDLLHRSVALSIDRHSLTSLIN